MLDEILCNSLENLTPDELQKAERDFENRCERIEYGLQAIGAMMQSLSYFAQCPDQDYSREPLSVQHVANIGGLILESGKLLTAFREGQANAAYYQANPPRKGGAKC